MDVENDYSSMFSDIVRSLGKNLILASGSPRREALLRSAGFDFAVRRAGVREVIDREAAPEANARANALAKAKFISRQLPDALILAADTLVFLGGEYFGKPRDARHAEKILETLSGTRHCVVTGVALIDEEAGIEISQSDRTFVTMKNVSREKIREYVRSGGAHGKAGAFAIQEVGDDFIERIEGSYTNVVGLPMELVKEMFEEYLEKTSEKES